MHILVRNIALDTVDNKFYVRSDRDQQYQALLIFFIKKSRDTMILSLLVTHVRTFYINWIIASLHHPLLFTLLPRKEARDRGGTGRHRIGTKKGARDRGCTRDQGNGTPAGWLQDGPLILSYFVSEGGPYPCSSYTHYPLTLLLNGGPYPLLYLADPLKSTSTNNTPRGLYPHQSWYPFGLLYLSEGGPQQDEAGWGPHS